MAMSGPRRAVILVSGGLDSTTVLAMARAQGCSSQKVERRSSLVAAIGRGIAAVDAGLAALVEAGVLPHAEYDHARLLAHRAAVAEQFEIPWTAISHRMQRLLYAINAIRQPRVMAAVGTDGQGYLERLRTWGASTELVRVIADSDHGHDRATFELVRLLADARDLGAD
jgi:hypothetical protein